MAEFIVRLGTPAGEIVTRTVEAAAASEARSRLEREGFKVFAINAPKGDGAGSLAQLGGGRGGGAPGQTDHGSLLYHHHPAVARPGRLPPLASFVVAPRRTSPT